MFNKVYFEKDIFNYPLGNFLKEKYKSLEWQEIDSHNFIPELANSQNSQFSQLKNLLIIGTRKTHKYTENQKVSDFLVPYTSSGCSAMCLYCYLVCNYNKCSYFRLFVNREQMLSRLVKTSNNMQNDCVFEIGSNSDLVLENTITGNLVWTIENFARQATKGKITFPTKFSSTQPLYDLDHRGKVIFRMSVNPQFIIDTIELKTSPLLARIKSVNDMKEAGYQVGILIAPIILLDNYQKLYSELLDILAENLSEKVKDGLDIECIFLTYSYVSNAINKEAFPSHIEFFNRSQMHGQRKYYYKKSIKEVGEQFIYEQIKKKLPKSNIVYIC